MRLKTIGVCPLCFESFVSLEQTVLPELVRRGSVSAIQSGNRNFKGSDPFI